MKLKLTNGTVIEPALNQVGQVILGKTFPGMDYCEAAELLDAAPCDYLIAQDLSPAVKETLWAMDLTLRGAIERAEGKEDAL